MEENNKYIEENLNSDIPISIIMDKIIDEVTSNFRDYIVPVLFLGAVKGYTEVRKLFEDIIKNNPELNKDFINMTRCLPFVTVTMGLEIYQLSTFFNKNDYKNKTADDFYNDYLNKKFPNKFYQDFNSFMKKYGFRGEWELDIKNERFEENPKIILDQIFSSLLTVDENNNPKKDFEETNKKRPEVFKKLLSIAKTRLF